MLFDLHPKERINDLFGRDHEVTYIIDQIIKGNWVVVLGQRMIGKTSVLKVSLNELEKRGYSILYVNLRGVKSLDGLLDLMVTEINKKRSLFSKLSVSLNLSVGPLGLEVRSKGRPFNTLLELLLSFNEEIVIGIDEFQEVSRVSRQILDILSNVFNSNKNVSFIFSGSYVGVIKTLFEQTSALPLYGRPPVKVSLKPFSRDISKEFMVKGFNELGVRVGDSIVERCYDKFDGIVGWLTMFGNFYGVRGMDFDEAVMQTIENAKKIIISEIEHFLEDKLEKNLYKAIFEALKISNRWKDIKFGVEVKLRKSVNDKIFTQALNALINANFVTKINGRYYLSDPMLKEIF